VGIDHGTEKMVEKHPAKGVEGSGPTPASIMLATQEAP
jgi:hypothetical protein